MVSESECLSALEAASERLGKSPSKREYEEIGMTPASATIIRVVGGWNEAKKKAELSVDPSTGSRVGPKPDSVELPPELEWKELSVDQRWHYRNAEWNKERTLRRRAELRQWVNERKRSDGCRDCGATDVAVLDCHHRDPEQKEMSIGDMITHGYGKDRLARELSKCVVLCSNCHRKEHADEPEAGLRAWVHEHKKAKGCNRCEEPDPRCLVFHHRGDKQDTIADMISDSLPRETIRSEMDRCVVLCSNCHRKEHFEPPHEAG